MQPWFESVMKCLLLFFQPLKCIAWYFRSKVIRKVTSGADRVHYWLHIRSLHTPMVHTLVETRISSNIISIRSDAFVVLWARTYIHGHRYFSSPTLQILHDTYDVYCGIDFTRFMEFDVTGNRQTIHSLRYTYYIVPELVASDKSRRLGRPWMGVFSVKMCTKRLGTSVQKTEFDSNKAGKEHSSGWHCK